MSVTVAVPVVAVSAYGDPLQTETDRMEDSFPVRKRRSGLLNVWTAPSLEEAVPDSTPVSTELGDDRDDLDSGNGSRKPSLISSSGEANNQETVKPQDRSEPTWRMGEMESAGKMFSMVNSYVSAFSDEEKRKTSDPFAIQRRENLRRTEAPKQRCLSDTQAYLPETLQVMDDTGDCGSSAVGGDSGIGEYPKMPSEFESHSYTAAPSGNPTSLHADQHVRQRRLTPAPIPNLSILMQSSNLDPQLFQSPHQSEEEVQLLQQHRLSSHSTSSNHSSRKRSHLAKHLSLSSLGGSSDTLSLHSFCDNWDCQSAQTVVTDLLSNLGFEDFDNPQLIPDRFIPRDTEWAKPTYMMEQVLVDSGQQQVPSCPESPVSNISGQLSSSFPILSNPTMPSPQTVAIPTPASTTAVCGVRELDLPLGATAENFLLARSARPSSPPPGPPQPIRGQIPQTYTGAAIDPTINTYTRMNAALELIPEETASDLSPSPRWLSPRVSLDHSYLDLAVNQLGTSLNIASRKRSLPNREGYRISVDSMISEQDSIYFSITSYDEDLAREKEREREDTVPPLPIDDTTCRRRRKGVYTPPPELLSWLQEQNRIEEDDPDEQPWPFNEQAKLRKSLTELHLMQQRHSLTDSGVSDDRSPSPFPKSPTRILVPRRFSAHVKSSLTNDHFVATGKPRRVSLPSSCRFHPFEREEPVTPPYIEPSVSPNPSSEDSSSQHSSRLPPGITRSQALGYKRECLQLRAQLEASHEKLKSMEHLRRVEVSNFKHSLAETEENLRGELWLREKRTKDLEEKVEAHKRELRMLQQEQQVSIARAREEVRETKNHEISEIWAKSDQMVDELKEKISKVEEECRHLRLKEKHLMQKAHQQSVRNENEALQREVAQLKEQLRREKQASTELAKEKALETKQIRTKAAIEREEALKSLRSQLQKTHDAELSAVKQVVQDFGFAQSGAAQRTRQPPLAHSPVKAEMKKLRLLVEQVNEDLMEREKRVLELESQLKQMHMEHLLLEQELTKLRS